MNHTAKAHKNGWCNLYEWINTQAGRKPYLQSSLAVARGSFDSKWVNACNVAFEKGKVPLAEIIANDARSRNNV